ncbi:MAG: phosphohistidine phosphatase SixA [Candidatus Omnitrophica bacterium]|nr:phosphoglycerate mutase GpmB [bacterium]NUN97543.1 phosphohistidine phosphatase SixA [Candidatus Omnitrophota bacterium]
MPIYLFRHGEAHAVGERGIESDAERPLTPKGKELTQAVCHGLRALGVECDEIWHSPLVRAKQTAEIVRREFGLRKMVEQDGLAYLTEAEHLFLSLADIPSDKNLFLVGHQPQLGDWVVRLVSNARGGNVALSKSGVARIDLLRSPAGPPRGELKWMLNAKILRRLA